jgi:sodium-dependent dicarboxylate transporter 2/3/5
VDAVDRDRVITGPLGRGERFVTLVFATTALAWIAREPKVLGSVRVPGLSDLVPGLSDASIAMIAALVLFTIPLRRARYATALDWESARRIPWGVLLLFGGGLALAAAFETSGLTAWIGGRLAGLRGAPLPIVIAATAMLFLALTELTSNTATAALGMPLIAGAAGGLGLPALPLMATVALASSMAFMLPVATPPNAIVFGSGAVQARDMLRAGVRLVGCSLTCITLVMWWWA